MRQHRAPFNEEKALLGDSLATLIGSTASSYPHISESQFKREVAPILVNLMSPQLLEHYLPYVGLLTKPLKVVEDHDVNTVLFTVPALMQSPRTSVPYGNGLSAEHMFRALARDIELGHRKKADLKIVSFMSRMTAVPDYNAVVIVPLREILAKYGYVLNLTTELVAVGAPSEQPTAAKAAPVTPSPAGNSFSDEYEDD